MANERITENMVEERLRALGFYADKDAVIVEKQQSAVAAIRTALSKAPKQGKGGGGQTAMESLREQKEELESVIQAERVKAVLAEDDISIGAFHARFAKATMDSVETREQLLRYFVDKIFVWPETLSIASWFYDHGSEITHENLVQAKIGEAPTLSREFSTSLGVEVAVSWFRTSEWGVSRHRHSVSQVIGMTLRYVDASVDHYCCSGRVLAVRGRSGVPGSPKAGSAGSWPAGDARARQRSNHALAGHTRARARSRPSRSR